MHVLPVDRRPSFTHTVVLMRVRSFRVVPLVVTLVAASFLVSARAEAQGTRRVNGATSTSTRTRGAGGDPNIRVEEGANPVDKPATPEPPGKNTRGLAAVEKGYMCVDSRVDLLVKLYVDGAFAGTVPPWGDTCIHYGAGDRRLYARALFTDGSVSAWGPVVADVTPGFRWTIKP